MSVFVLDRRGKPLMPFSEKRARLSLERGRARAARRYPFTIRLIDRTVEERARQPVRIKIDPASKTTGCAMGSVPNCRKPASVKLRTRIGWYLAPSVVRALADAAPDKVQAATGLPVAVHIYGRGANGTVYTDHFFMGAGQDGSAHGDDKSTVLYPTSTANTSVELTETRAPVLVLKKSFVTDSGGAGKHRRDCDVRTRPRKLYDGGLPMLMSVDPEGVGGIIEGLHGGGVHGVVLDVAGNVVRDCGPGELVTQPGTDRIVGS